MSQAQDIRWIILGPDGRHNTLGRHSDPTEAELADVAASMTKAGVSGWLAVLKGGYYTRRTPELLMVRILAGAPGSWDDAAQAFEAKRRETVQAAG